MKIYENYTWLQLDIFNKCGLLSLLPIMIHKEKHGQKSGSSFSHHFLLIPQNNP